jgi:hypothetical protein
MDHPLIKIGAAVVLGTALLACPAYAHSPSSHNHHSFLLAQAGDEENAEVWHDLRPDVTPPEAAVGKTDETPKEDAQPLPRKEEGSRSGDVEEREMKEDGLNVPQ